MKDKRELILEAFNNRFACKSYDPNKKISDEDFETIMEAGRLSPSSFGYEPWQFLLIKNERIKRAIYPHAWGAQASLEGASHFVIILTRKAKDVRYDSEYIKYIINDVQEFPQELIKDRLAKFKDFQENDFKLLESERSLSDWASKQSYIALANMLTTAAFLGIDSTPIEGFHREKVEEILVEEGILDPEHFSLSIMAAFGYSNREHRAKTRRKMQEVWKIVD